MSTGEIPDIEIGVVTRPHGVKGAVLFRPHNPDSSALSRCQEISLEQLGKRRTVPFRTAGMGKGGAPILIIEGISSREQADELRGAAVFVPRDAIEPLSEDEYLFEDLVGCSVLDENDQPLGEVIEVLDHGAAPILRLRHDQKELMIPLAEEWVTDIDLTARTLKVDAGDQWRELATDL